MFLSRARTALLATAVAISAVMIGSLGSPAVASDRSYLALGDSVVFGYIAHDVPAYVNPANFIGYPQYVGSSLNLATANASCAGEASGGFQNVTTGNDNGCRFYRSHWPLHVAYAGSQLAFATAFLKSHPKTRLVTLGLGANDAFILQRTCTTQQCLTDGLAVMSANIDAILGAIRAIGYKGVLVVVNYYSLDYSDATQVAGTQLLNHFVTASAAAHGAVVADAYTAFQKASAAAGGKTCFAGLLNGDPAVNLACDVHPSQTGQQVLAQAVEEAYFAATADSSGA
ncbi:MAG TPA: SGNH/GDSL hydrolase family protein [Candidatus Dormibacteraeota bacterium]|jgi:lysophospholipase L1-like esterase